MAFDFKIELHHTNELLERIAISLERACGKPITELPDFKKRGPEAITKYGNENRIWLKENFQNLIHERGYAPDMEQQLLNQAMEEFDQAVETEAMGGSSEAEGDQKG
jgi:hypothetical protein